MITLSPAERDAALRLREFRDLRARGALCTAVTAELATKAADQFLEAFQVHGTYLGDAIALLAEISTLEEPCLSDPGQRATFPLLIERLSDSFDPALCPLYDRAFSQILSHARKLPAAARLDSTLRDFGLESDQDLLERKMRVTSARRWIGNPTTIKKVLALSRVTLGADVALTSIVLQKLRVRFPGAERVLIGTSKAPELFGGDESLRIMEVPYAGSGSLLERLESWRGIIQRIADEIQGLAPEEYLLIDPDSRYLQLGMLPALQDESRYFFFDSRSAGSGRTESLSRLTAEWWNGIFGEQPESLWPRVWLRSEDQQSGRSIVRNLRESAPSIVALSFGVGGNPAKRLPDPFEEELVTQLLREGATIILDQGAGEDERERALRLAESAARGGFAAEIAGGAAPDRRGAGRLRTWRGGIGAWAGIIAASDCFIGYDSAGQHIAAALGVPTIDIFSANTTPLFRERWKPTGSGPSRIVVESRLESQAGSGSEPVRENVDAVMQAVREWIGK